MPKPSLTLTAAAASAPLTGEITVPGDKSISHRALILTALARGQSRITGLLESEDVLATEGALKSLGVNIRKTDNGDRLVGGIGTGAFIAPDAPLDLGNSGTGARLLMGAVAGCGITAVFTGDASLSMRPMQRITAPLTQMGAVCTARDDKFLPLTITGTPTPRAIEYRAPVASAQIKSAILLAGLTARGATRVIEPAASRDHTESMLRHFGAEVVSADTQDGHSVTLTGEAALQARDIAVPSDPSSAAFFAVAALITEGSAITLKGVSTNPRRFGLYETLMEMGADITLTNNRNDGGEAVADLIIKHAHLRGVKVPAARSADMIDEYPILAIAAACADGETQMDGIAELRVKETDRIAVMEKNLKRLGVAVASTKDTMRVMGHADTIKGGLTIDAEHDHRIAMAFAVLGLIAAAPITITGAETIATSFPNFATLMREAGADISEAAAASEASASRNIIKVQYE